MPDRMTPEEVATLIRARKIAREKGLHPDADVSAICKAAGISRKTGYEWAEKFSEQSAAEKKLLSAELDRLKSEHDKLKREFADVSFENRGRKLAWEIHHVDEWLSSKKNTSDREKDKKR
jgi:predicted DNA-binding transcriptional regulator AlpA